MLTTMLLAERVSQKRRSAAASIAEAEQEKAMTQSLIIAQQCALEQLEHYEDEVEKESELAMQLPGVADAATRDSLQGRRRSRGRLLDMFNGLSLVTSPPSPTATPQRLPDRAERTSVWLDSILALPDDNPAPHPGQHKQKRLSSVGTANAPLQMLRKWTDQVVEPETKHEPTVSPIPEGHHGLWRGTEFSFSGESTLIADNDERPQLRDYPTVGIARAPTDLVSPKTARVQSIGFHMVVGVNGALEYSNVAQFSVKGGDDYDSIAKSILNEYGAMGDPGNVELCVAYGGKTKILKHSDKPLDVLSHYEELELEPRLFVRHTWAQPP